MLDFLQSFWIHSHSTKATAEAKDHKLQRLLTNSYNAPKMDLPLAEQRITETDGNRLGLRVIRQSRLSQLPTDTALLVPTKRQLVVQGVVSVDPDGTGAQGVGDADGGVEVGGVDGGGETVGGAVADPDGVFLVLELGDGADGAKDLFLHDLHVFADVGEDGRFDEVAFLAVAVAADFDLGAGFLAFFDVSDRC